MKVCIKCNTKKTYKHFSKTKRTKDGYQYYCKTCLNNIDKEYRKIYRNKDGIGVYGLYNKIEQCWDYIGQGKLKAREMAHKQTVALSTPVEVKLNIWFEGFDNVYEFRVLCKCDNRKQCLEMETKYINELNSRYNKYKRQHKVEV